MTAIGPSQGIIMTAVVYTVYLVLIAAAVWGVVRWLRHK